MGERLARCLLEAIDQVRQAGLPPLDQRGETLYCWREEIARMWRFSKTTPSPKASTTEWRSSAGRRTASETSKTTEGESNARGSVRKLDFQLRVLQNPLQSAEQGEIQ